MISYTECQGFFSQSCPYSTTLLLTDLLTLLLSPMDKKMAEQRHLQICYLKHTHTHRRWDFIPLLFLTFSHMQFSFHCYQHHNIKKALKDTSSLLQKQTLSIAACCFCMKFNMPEPYILCIYEDAKDTKLAEEAAIWDTYTLF